MDDAISRIEAALDFAGSHGWHPFHCEDIIALLDRLDAAEAENERMRDALDALGVAIADAGYTWTPAMRAAYERGEGRNE